MVLFVVGGIIAALSSIFGWKSTSDDYEVFARKCFLGTQGDEEPRFRDDPPAWSLALKSGKNTWPIDKQKRALHNLLGQFSVKTRIANWQPGPSFDGEVTYEIAPGMFQPGTTIEFEMHHSVGGRGKPTSVNIEWDPEGVSGDHQTVVVAKNGGFNPDASEISFQTKNGNPTKIIYKAKGVKFDSDYGSLMTLVSVRYPGLLNVISCLKAVIENNSNHMSIDNNEEVSALFA